MVRKFLATVIACAAAQILSAEHVYIGGFGPGIYLAEFDAKTGKLTAPALNIETALPSFLALHPDGRYLYAVNETNDGRVSGFSIDHASGKLTAVNSASVKAPGPCHLTIDKGGHWILVANYAGGSVTVLPIESGGRVGEATDFIQHKGSGPNRDRQTAPHAHWVGFAPGGGHLALVADLGLDEIAIYRFDGRHGKLTPSTPAFANVPPGAGARHAVFHPNGKFFYVINELNSTITELYYEVEFKRLTSIQTVKTLPENFSGQNSCAEIAIHPSGKFVYGSNRGHDSIAVFSVDPKKGNLTLVEHVSTRGKTPRSFELDPSGRWLLAANQDSDNIAVFQIDPETGKLKPMDLVAGVSKPACIKFLGK